MGERITTNIKKGPLVADSDLNRVGNGITETGVAVVSTYGTVNALGAGLTSLDAAIPSGSTSVTPTLVTTTGQTMSAGCLTPAAAIPVGNLEIGAVMAVFGGGPPEEEVLTTAEAIVNALRECRRANMRKGSLKKRRSTANQLDKDPNKPIAVEEVHPGKIYGEKPHVHFRDGSALNWDGTWKHTTRSTRSTRVLSNAEKDWLTQHGWDLPSS